MPAITGEMSTYSRTLKIPDPYFKTDPRIAVLEEKIKETRDFIADVEQGKGRFSEKRCDQQCTHTAQQQR